jgi:hypothetical protein
VNINKAEIKIFTAHELGCRLDDLLESNTKDMYRLEGGVVALRQAITALEGLLAVVDKEMDADKFDLEQAKEIKRYVQRAVQVVTNMTLNTDNNRIAYGGRIAALTSAVEIAKKYQAEESKKVASLQEAVAQNRVIKDGDSHEMTDSDSGRPVAVRPGLSLKEQRLAEEAAEKILAPTETISEPTVTAEIEQATNVTSILPKRRGRPRKSA